MKKRLDGRWSLGLVAALVLGGCEPAAGKTESIDVLALVKPEPGVWWTHLGQQSSVAAYLGPAFRGSQELEGRIWTLACTALGAEEPLACLQGFVLTDSEIPVLYEGPSFRVELRPIAGLTWGEVSSREQLETEIEGFF